MQKHENVRAGPWLLYAVVASLNKWDQVDLHYRGSVMVFSAIIISNEQFSLLLIHLVLII